LIVSVIVEIWNSLFAKTVALIISPIVFYLVFSLSRRVYLAFKALQLTEAALKSVAREKKNGLWTEGLGFWLKRPITRPSNYNDLQGNSIPILMIAATKGGVGKTSLAGSLAAHFALRWTQRRQDQNADRPLRVLVIDQDFQGSFSTMTVDVDHRYQQPSKANRLVSGALADGSVALEAEPVTQPGMLNPLSIRTIPAYYDLAQAENRVLIEWLFPLSVEGLASRLLHFLRIGQLQPRSFRDIRYVLAEALLDPQVQATFDLVIIDSPPRLTPSHIQAMCASTHLIIPTILDGLSGDAVARYLDQVATHKLGPAGNGSHAICPYLQTIGIVCTLVPNNRANLEGPLTVLGGRIAAAPVRPNIVPQDCFIRQRPLYRQHAGEIIAYASLSKDQDHRELRAEVDNLGDWIAPRLGAEARGWTRLET
jgi:chromosome partitioning protein